MQIKKHLHIQVHTIDVNYLDIREQKLITATIAKSNTEI